MIRRITPLLAACAPFVFTALASACPMCKDSIPNSDAQSMGGLPAGFNSSVYLMLFAFFGTLGLISHVIYKGVRSTGITAGAFPVIPQQGSSDATSPQCDDE